MSAEADGTGDKGLCGSFPPGLVVLSTDPVIPEVVLVSAVITPV